jgi:hypothetical protein
VPLHVDLFVSLCENRVIDGLHRLDSGGPVRVIRPSLIGPFLKASYLRNVSGKGLTESSAQLTCCAETVERLSAEFDRSKISLTCDLDLADARALIASIMPYSSHQFRNRERLNIGSMGINNVPQEICSEDVLDWVVAEEVEGNSTILVPAGYVFFGYKWPSGKRHAIADSNGLAAATSIEDATEAGCLELIERDAAAIWWYNRLDLPGIKTDEASSATGIPVAPGTWVRNLTHDIGVSVYVAYSTNAPDGIPRLGFGADLDPTRALRKALLEHWQVSWMKPPRDKVSLLWPEVNLFAEQPHLLPPQTFTSFSPNKVPEPIGVSLTRRLRTLGLRTFRFLYEPRGYPLRVVKVIIPGLRSMWDRRGPGRLYDVPVALGWLDRPNDEAQLNPVPINL